MVVSMLLMLGVGPASPSLACHCSAWISCFFAKPLGGGKLAARWHAPMVLRLMLPSILFMLRPFMDFILCGLSSFYRRGLR